MRVDFKVEKISLWCVACFFTFTFFNTLLMLILLPFFGVQPGFHVDGHLLLRFFGVCVLFFFPIVVFRCFLFDCILLFFWTVWIIVTYCHHIFGCSRCCLSSLSVFGQGRLMVLQISETMQNTDMPKKTAVKRKTNKESALTITKNGRNKKKQNKTKKAKQDQEKNTRNQTKQKDHCSIVDLQRDRFPLQVPPSDDESSEPWSLAASPSLRVVSFGCSFMMFFTKNRRKSYKTTRKPHQKDFFCLIVYFAACRLSWLFTACQWKNGGSWEKSLSLPIARVFGADESGDLKTWPFSVPGSDSQLLKIRKG